MVRRSTIDDCSGPRYEELMLAVSKVVLQAYVEAGRIPNVANTIGLFADSSTLVEGAS